MDETFPGQKSKKQASFREQFCRYFQPVTEQETTAVRRKINVGGLGRQSRGQRDAGTSSEHRARMCFIITIYRGMEHPLLGSTRRASSSEEVRMKSGPRKHGQIKGSRWIKQIITEFLWQCRVQTTSLITDLSEEQIIKSASGAALLHALQVWWHRSGS